MKIIKILATDCLLLSTYIKPKRCSTQIKPFTLQCPKEQQQGTSMKTMSFQAKKKKIQYKLCHVAAAATTGPTISPKNNGINNELWRSAHAITKKIIFPQFLHLLLNTAYYDDMRLLVCCMLHAA